MAEGSMIPKLIRLALEWTTCQPLNPEIERRLWKKLRLDWNYNSNHIEGNTLTYGETELLLIHGQTHGSHDFRDYLEMKAHDVAISRLQELAVDNRPFTEAEIREWNLIILKEPYWKDAITPDGSPSRKEIIPGKYKTAPNSARTPTGALFDFAAPMDVPARMGDLVARLNDCLITKSGVDELPAKLAQTHHDFVMIHPFDDGNGRVARLISNYLLLRHGLLPIVVPSDEKKAYLRALREADAGLPDGLTSFFAELMITSLDSGLSFVHDGK